MRYMRKESPYYNETKGIQYLERAKEQGNDRAKYFLGKIYLDKTSSEYSLFPIVGSWRFLVSVFRESPRSMSLPITTSIRFTR